MMKKTPEVSVVVPISERHDDIKQLYELYSKEIEKQTEEFEFLFVLDGQFPEAYDQLVELSNNGNPIRILRLAKNLLKQDGVLICAIDENELWHLGTLLEEVFASREIHLITIVHNQEVFRARIFHILTNLLILYLIKTKK